MMGRQAKIKLVEFVVLAKNTSAFRIFLFYKTSRPTGKLAFSMIVLYYTTIKIIL